MWEATEENQCAWVPATHAGDPDVVPGAAGFGQAQPQPLWPFGWKMPLPFSPFLCNSPSLYFANK